MRIALVYPPCGELRLKGYPLGLAYLSASLKPAHEVEIFDYNGKEFKKSIKAFLKAVQEKEPDLVGVSFNSFNRGGAYQMLNNIKKINKNIIVVLGGVHPSIQYKQLFQYFYDKIDFIIQSEGENSFRQLCDSLHEKRGYRGISGLVYKNGNGSIVANPVTETINDLDDLPLPDFSYAQEEIAAKEIAFLITSRGCPVNCSFCSTSSFWGQNVRMNSPEKVAVQVEYVKKLGARRLFFHDDTFNLGIGRTIKLAAILKKFNLEYAIQCRVKPVNEEMIMALVDSGCKHISWGVESLSDRVLRQINKNITKEEVKNAFDICAKFVDRLTTSAYCCVGIPGETEETVQETIDYFNKNIRSTHGPGASILYILPGTRIYYGLLRNQRLNEKVWIKSDAVYYYTQERSIFTLNKWRKKINRSGIKLPYKGKYFWDLVSNGGKERNNSATIRFRRIGNKIRRFINLIRNRY